jgi:hypothetical protein
MSEYPEPIRITSVFNSNNFLADLSSLTISDADSRYCKLTGFATSGVSSINGLSSSSISITDAINNGYSSPLILQHKLSSGTAATGMANSLRFAMPDTAGSLVNYGGISSVIVSATAGATSGTININPSYAGTLVNNACVFSGASTGQVDLVLTGVGVFGRSGGVSSSLNALVLRHPVAGTTASTGIGTYISFQAPYNTLANGSFVSYGAIECVATDTGASTFTGKFNFVNTYNASSMTAMSLLPTSSTTATLTVNTVTATSLAGTLSTGAQPNITSLGTIASLDCASITGACIFNGADPIASSTYNGSAIGIAGTACRIEALNYNSLNWQTLKLSSLNVMITDGSNDCTQSYAALNVADRAYATGISAYAFAKLSGGAFTTGYVPTNSGSINVSIFTDGRIICSDELNFISDRRLKDDIKDITDFDLNAFKKIESKSFKYKKNGDYSYGFIAQDLLKNSLVLPVTCIKNEELEETDEFSPAGNQFILNYNSLIPLLHKWNLELEKRIAKLEKK